MRVLPTAPRIVLDTSVLASAVRSGLGASFAAVEAVRDNRVRLLATPPLFLEYEAILKRSEQRSVSRLSLAEVDEMLEELAALAEPVEVHVSWRPQLTDANDELVLEAAINGRCDALVTHNLRDFRNAAPRFGIRLLTPGELLREVR